MSKSTASKLKFKGYASPNYTPVPDELFDEQLPDLSGAELKVLLYIIRRTFGFKKDSDNISLNQLLNGIVTREGTVLDRGTGLSKKTLLETIKNLVEKNLIITERRRSKERGDEPTTYRLNIIGVVKENTTTPRGVKSIPGGVEKNTPGGSDKNYSSQETVLQNTDIQHRNSNSKIENIKSKDNRGYQNFQAVGNILKRKTEPKTFSLKEIPDSIKVTIQEISQEFGEPRKTRSNLTRTINLIHKSGKNKDTFYDYLYRARSITKQQESVRKNMPYFFEVLEDLIGLKTNTTFSIPNSR